MKYTFLSKWTVLIMTVITIGLWGLGGYLLNNGHNIYGVLTFIIGLLVYALAWFIALFDSIQERKWGWLLVLFLLLPSGIGPLIYSLFGPKNTK